MCCREGKWELRALKNGERATHNEASAPNPGKRGFSTVEQRASLMQMFESAAVHARPRQALRAYLLDPLMPTEGLSLAQVQRLSKTTRGEMARARVDLGDIAKLTSGFCSVPAGRHDPFFCVREVVRTKGGAPKVTLVASTKALLDRWHESSV